MRHPPAFQLTGIPVYAPDGSYTLQDEVRVPVPAAAAGGGAVCEAPAAAGGVHGGPQPGEPAGTHPTDRCVTFTPHWVTVSIRRSLPDVMALVADHFLGAQLGDDPATLFDPAGRSRFYGVHHQAFGGITILSEFTQRAKDHCLVNVPGSALEQLPGGGLPALCGFLGHLIELQGVSPLVDDAEASEATEDDSPGVPAGRVFKVTRLDLAFDHVPFTVEQCIEAAAGAEARNVRSPVRKGTAFHSLGERDPGEDGDTFTWGARASKSRMVRAYNKRGFVRFEMEWRGDRSDLLARELAQLAPAQWARRSIAHLRDFIDFIDRDSSSNVSRCALLPWWAEFVQGVDRIRIKIERPAVPLVAKVANAVRRVRRNVAKLDRAFGRAWVDHHLVRMGEFSMTAADRREVVVMREIGERDPESVGLYDTLRSKLDQVVDQVVGAAWSQSALVFGH